MRTSEEGGGGVSQGGEKGTMHFVSNGHACLSTGGRAGGRAVLKSLLWASVSCSTTCLG